MPLGAVPDASETRCSRSLSRPAARLAYVDYGDGTARSGPESVKIAAFACLYCYPCPLAGSLCESRVLSGFVWDSAAAGTAGRVNRPRWVGLCYAISPLVPYACVDALEAALSVYFLFDASRSSRRFLAAAFSNNAAMAWRTLRLALFTNVSAAWKQAEGEDRDSVKKEDTGMPVKHPEAAALLKSPVLPASCAKSETCHTLRGTELSPVGGSFVAASMIAPTLGRKGLGLNMPIPGGRQNLAPSWSTRRLSSACARMVPQAATRRSVLYSAAHTLSTSLVDRCHSAVARCRSLPVIDCDHQQRT